MLGVIFGVTKIVLGAFGIFILLLGSSFVLEEISKIPKKIPQISELGFFIKTLLFLIFCYSLYVWFNSLKIIFTTEYRDDGTLFGFFEPMYPVLFLGIVNTVLIYLLHGIKQITDSDYIPNEFPYMGNVFYFGFSILAFVLRALTLLIYDYTNHVSSESISAILIGVIGALISIAAGLVVVSAFLTYPLFSYGILKILFFPESRRKEDERIRRIINRR